MNNKDLQVLIAYATKNEGATLNYKGDVITLHSGYMVSVERYGLTLTSVQELDLATFKAYQKIAKKINACIGLWIDTSDNNKFYLDISINILNKDAALEYAKQENQLAIYDCFNQKCVNVQ